MYICIYACQHISVSISPLSLSLYIYISKHTILVSISYSSEHTHTHTHTYIYIYIIIYFLKFFTSALTDGFSLESEWQQVSSSLQDSSQYSGRSQKWSSLDGLHSSANLQVLQSLCNPLVTVPNALITIGIIVTCMFHSFFNSLARLRYLSFFSHSFSFNLWSAGTAKSTILLIIIRSGLLAEIRWSVCMTKSIRVYASHFLGQVLGCAYTICWYGQI